MPNLLKNSNINLESGNLRPEIRRWSLESENWHPDARIMESTPENGAQEWRGQTLVLRGTLAPAGQNGGTARAAWGSSRGLWGTFVEATESCKMRQAGRINPQNKWSKCHFYLALGQGLGSKRCHCASCWCSLGPCGHLAKQFFGLHRRLLAAGADSSDRRCGRISVSGGAPRRNGCAPGEIRKIWDLANENHMFLDTINLRFSVKIVGNSRVEAVTARIRRSWPARRGLPERGGQPEGGCRNEVWRDREAREIVSSNILLDY